MTLDELAQEFIEHRPRLFGIAYRMLGSAWDAEDVVADAMIRWLDVDRSQVRQPIAFLTTVVTRLALDQLRSARATRETYIGPWLPEPVVTDTSTQGPVETLERKEAVSLATLRMMESLTPAERAVLVLHDAFNVPHTEIAAILGITADGARQHLHRARARITGQRTRFKPDRQAHDALFRRFLAALEHGHLNQLQEVLAADVVSYSDGGGKARAARHPISGADRVASFFTALRKRLPITDVRLLEVNGYTAAYLRFGRQLQLLAIEADDGQVREILSIINPDKLGYIQHQLAQE